VNLELFKLLLKINATKIFQILSVNLTTLVNIKSNKRKNKQSI